MKLEVRVTGLKTNYNKIFPWVKNLEILKWKLVTEILSLTICL